ncbi:hypothetical protein Tco_0734071 [Tanacetum coccineum]
MTMEEYIKFEEEKARKRRKVFNWQTATYGKIKVDDDLHDLSSVEAEFPAIVINDAFASKIGLQGWIRRIRIKPIRHMVLPPCEQRHRFLRYEGLDYPDTNIVDFEGRLSRIHMREVHRVTIFNFRGLLDLMVEGLTARMMMEHRDKSVLVCSPVGLGGGLSVRLSKEAYELEAVHLSPGITYGGGDADGWVWCLLGREFQTDP